MFTSFHSRIEHAGHVDLPPFAGTRILLMPFHLHDPHGTLPDSIDAWRDAVASLVALAPHRRGVGYLTIDEALVKKGETHRRPGLHCDGVGPLGIEGASWASPGERFTTWASPSPKEVPKPQKRPIPQEDAPPRKKKKRAGGMLVVASHVGCRGWHKPVIGAPGPDGDCAHLAAHCGDDDAIIMLPGEAYWCNAFGVHEALPMPHDTHRQFVRLSMPSPWPWYEGCTPNPLGIMPEGPIAPRRDRQMSYRLTG